MAGGRGQPLVAVGQCPVSGCWAIADGKVGGMTFGRVVIFKTSGGLWLLVGRLVASHWPVACGPLASVSIGAQQVASGWQLVRGGE